MAGTPVGKTVSLEVLRGKKETTVDVTIAKMKEEEMIASTTEKGDLGLTVEQITPDIAEDLGLEQTRGVVITAVAPDGLGDEAGFQPGDIIREINRQPVRDLSDYRENYGKRRTKQEHTLPGAARRQHDLPRIAQRRIAMLGDIGLPELLVIFIIVLVLFGPGKLPDVGKAIGEALRGFKKALKEPDNTIAERSNDKDEKDYEQSS